VNLFISSIGELSLKDIKKFGIMNKDVSISWVVINGGKFFYSTELSLSILDN